jgi:putative two-component system response regulator
MVMSVVRDPGLRILIVDDEPPIRSLLSRFLGSRGFQTAQAGSGEQALAMLNQDRFSLVLSDVKMPGMSGMSLLSEVRRINPEIGVLMLTGCEDISTAVEAMKKGAFDYLLKPFDLPRVEAAVRHAIERQSALREQADRLERLEETVRDQTVRLRTLLGNLNEASEGTLEALVAALDAREHETKAHSRRVAEYTVYLAGRTGIDGEPLDTIRRGAMLHDVGKIGISDNILLKPAPLSDAEWGQMRRHPQIGFWILEGIESLRSAAEIVLSHHERYDGLGYPRGLRGEEIPLGARIFSVADSLDAITSDRPYQRGQSMEAARKEILLNSGAQFDPAVVASFVRIPPDVWHDIRNRTSAESVRPIPDVPPVVLEQCR